MRDYTGDLIRVINNKRIGAFERDRQIKKIRRNKAKAEHGCVLRSFFNIHADVFGNLKKGF